MVFNNIIFNCNYVFHIVAKAFAIGFSQETIDLAAPLFAINFYYLPIIFTVTFMAALLQYKHHFATSAFSTALLNLGMIGALLISQNLDKYEITFYLSYGLFWRFFTNISSCDSNKRANLCKIFHFKNIKKGRK